MIQRTVRIPAEIWEQALEYTDAERTTISDVMRDALTEYVETRAKRAKRRDKRAG